MSGKDGSATTTRKRRAVSTRRPAQQRSRRGRRPASARAKTGTRPSRRSALRRRWITLLTVITVAVIGYLLLFTSLLGVRSVEVIGAKTVSTDQIVAAAQVPDRRPMVRVDTGQIRDRVLALPGVATVDVSRSWPSTIEIEVTERAAVAYFDGGDGIHLVDAGGVDFKKVAATPEGLVQLRLARVAPDDPVTKATLTVLGQLPQQLRPKVVAAGAKTPAGVELYLADGKTVRWGDVNKTDRKAAVLAALLPQPGTVYDVTSPELPTVS